MRVARAARYWRVPPWEPIPEVWIARAEALADAEDHAREVARKRAEAARR